MDNSRFQLAEHIWLDARRALWLADARVLAVADLHLGYAWAQRLRGQLLPLAALQDTAERLLALQRDYEPREIVLLGDIVHRAVALPALEAELNDLLNRLAPQSALTLVMGNHDRNLDQLLARRAPLPQLVSERAIGPHLFIHGDVAAFDEKRRKQIRAQGGRIIMGHEHPAITLGDGVASSAKCPCFMAGEDVIILPAFSDWAAGTVIGNYPFMSALARSAVFTHAVAVMGDKLLPVPLGA